MKTSISLLLLLLCMAVLPVCSVASPTLAIKASENVGAGMATLVLKSSGTGTGYFTLLNGSGTACGSGANVQAGQDSTGGAAPYHGSLPLTANVAGRYTVRNLTQDTAYTICFTADSPSGQNLQPTPARARLHTTVATEFTNPSWEVVGSAGFSAGEASFTSLAFAPNGTLYLAYMDASNDYKATVMEYSGGAWFVVGSAGFSAGEARSISLAFAPDGVPHVAYCDSANGGKSTVMKYDGDDWILVGNAGFSVGSAFAGISLAFAPDGAPHVANGSVADINKAAVLKYSDGTWSVVGGAGFSAGEAEFTSLAFAPDGTPYVAYQDYSNHYGVTVMMYCGGVWVPVGNAGFSAGVASFTSLAFAPDGTPQVAYRDESNGGYTTLMKYDGGVWGPVGNAGFSADEVSFTSLAFAPDGTPYVANSAAYNSKATVMKFDGTDWVTVGSPRFSAGEADFTSLAFAPDGTPYVAFTDGGNSFKATVMMLKSHPLIGVTPPGKEFGSVAVGASAAQTFTLSNSGTDPLTVSSITLTGGDSGMFTLNTGTGTTGTCGATPTIAKNKSCTIRVTFAPTTPGDRSATLRIASNDPVDPEKDVALNGTGVLRLAVTTRPQSPAPAGGKITFTATAFLGSGTYQYGFSCFDPSGTPIAGQAYGSSNAWTWKTAGLPKGTYQVRVWARNAGSTADHEAVKTMSYRLLPPRPVASLTVTASPKSPMATGSKIDFTATASGGWGTYEYQYRVRRNPAGTWSSLPYGSSYTWTWDTAGLSAGTYSIQVRARNSGSAASFEAVKSVNYVILPPPPSVPANLTAAGSLRKIQLSWSASSGSHLTGYNIYRSTDGEAFVRINATPVTETTYDNTIASPGGDGVFYYYRVTASGDSESGFSNVVREMHGTRLSATYPAGFTTSASASPYVAGGNVTVDNGDLTVAVNTKLYILDNGTIDIEQGHAFTVNGLLRVLAATSAPAALTSHGTGGVALTGDQGFRLAFIGAVDYAPGDNSGTLLQNTAITRLQCGFVGGYPAIHISGCMPKLYNTYITASVNSAAYMQITGGSVIMQNCSISNIYPLIFGDQRTTGFQMDHNIFTPNSHDYILDFVSSSTPPVTAGQIANNTFDASGGGTIDLSAMTGGGTIPLGSNYWAQGLPSTRLQNGADQSCDFTTPLASPPAGAGPTW